MKCSCALPIRSEASCSRPTVSRCSRGSTVYLNRKSAHQPKPPLLHPQVNVGDPFRVPPLSLSDPLETRGYRRRQHFFLRTGLALDSPDRAHRESSMCSRSRIGGPIEPSPFADERGQNASDPHLTRICCAFTCRSLPRVGLCTCSNSTQRRCRKARRLTRSHSLRRHSR